MKKGMICVVALAGVSLAGLFRPLQGEPAAVPAPAGKAAVALEKKLNELILPMEPDTAGLTLEEAIEQLRVKAQKADADAPFFEQGVNMVILGGGKARLPNTTGLKLKDVPLSEALRHVTEQAGVKYHLDPYAVVITSAHSKPPAPPLTESDGPTEREKRLFRQLSQHLPRVVWQDCPVEEAAVGFRADSDVKPVESNSERDPIFTNVVLNLRSDIELPPLTFELHDIPKSEALRYIAEMSGLTLSLRSSAVILSDHDLGPPPTAPAKRSPVEVRASQIILQVVSLQESSMAESLDFLRQEALKRDPQKEGVKIIVRPGGGTVIRSLELFDIPLLDALDHIALQSGHRLSVEGNSFVLTPTN